VSGEACQHESAYRVLTSIASVDRDYLWDGRGLRYTITKPTHVRTRT
jgi:hypothetical protein